MQALVAPGEFTHDLVAFEEALKERAMELLLQEETDVLESPRVLFSHMKLTNMRDHIPFELHERQSELLGDLATAVVHLLEDGE